MKTDTTTALRCLAAALLALTASRLAADTLAADTAVFMQADAKSAVITRLKAGAAVTYAGEAPAGWRRVEIDGDFTAYAHSRDITKGLEVREGANILTAPEKSSAVLTVSQKGDKTEVIGLHGDYCQIRLAKKLQGFVATGATANAPGVALQLPPASTSAAAPAAATAPGRPVAISGNTADLPRLFTGTLVSAKRLLNPNPVYDYQLTDANGRRFAYVDTKRLVLTNRIESLLYLRVVVTGTVRNTVDGKDLVIDAEAMTLK